MAMQNNWFDDSFEKSFRVPPNATVDQKVDAALKLISSMPQVREELHRAIFDYEKSSKMSGWCGPSFSQAVRQAVAGALSADPEGTHY